MRSIKVSQSEKGRWGAGVSKSRQRGGLTRPRLGADRPRAYSGRGRRTAARITGISVSVCVFKKGWENPQMGLMCIMNEMMRTKPSAGNSEQMLKALTLAILIDSPSSKTGKHKADNTSLKVSQDPNIHRFHKQ